MIADKPHDTYSFVGKFSELSEKTHKTAGNHITVFIPIIKDVAEEIDHLGVILDFIEKRDHSLLCFL